jgi:anti-sigma B factor antagonist
MNSLRQQEAFDSGVTLMHQAVIETAAISLIDDGGRFTITLVGEFDQLTSAPINQVISLIAQHPRPRVIVEARGVTFACSSFLSMLIKMRKTVADQQGSLRLASTSPTLDRLLEVTGLARTFVVQRTDG